MKGGFGTDRSSESGIHRLGRPVDWQLRNRKGALGDGRRLRRVVSRRVIPQTLKTNLDILRSSCWTQ